MSAEKLAFLQNFYTDVTLYVPAEPQQAAPPRAAPAPPPALVPPPALASPPKQPAREAQLPPRSFSRPSAGLERLAANYVYPLSPAELAAARSTAAAAERAAASDSAHLATAGPGKAAPAAGPPALPSVPPVMLTPFATLGDNPLGVVLLVRLPREEFIKLHRNVFLNKMLQALSLVMADVLLVNVEGEFPVALENLRRQMAARRIIAFGKNLLDATIRNTQIYEPVHFPNLDLAYLASATVDLVEYDVSLKKRLWPGLQRMFLG